VTEEWGFISSRFLHSCVLLGEDTKPEWKQPAKRRDGEIGQATVSLNLGRKTPNDFCVFLADG
jgi:hypothetical protein